MKALKIIYSIIFFFIFFSLSSCTTTDENPVDSGGDFVPNFDNIWHDVNAETHTFQLQQSDRNVNHGLFKGSENYPDSNIFDSQIIGVFTNRNIEFNSLRDSRDVKFIGTITSDTTMDLTYFGRKIKIKKGS